jgi:hypothetical protein
MPDAEKRRRADLIVRTGLSRHASLKSLNRIIRDVRNPAKALNHHGNPCKQ